MQSQVPEDLDKGREMPSQAEMNSFFLEDLTWTEVELALTRGYTKVVLPLGAVEQHGPHLPLSADADRAMALALRVARRLGQALVAPVVRIGCSDFHMGYAGTLSIRPETLEAICSDVVESLAHHGFTDIYLLSAHGGNFQPLVSMLPRLQARAEAVDPACEVHAYTDLPEMIAVARWVVEEATGLGERVGGHADVAESSEMLYLRPEFVHPEWVEEGTLHQIEDEEDLARVFSSDFRSLTSNGVLGDPRGMRADLGARLLDATAQLIARTFIEAAEDAESDAGDEGGAERAVGGRADGAGDSFDDPTPTS
jgi:creatinine amidohydrolase